MTDIRLIYHIQKSKCYSCVWMVVDSINTHYWMEFPLNNIEKLKVLAAEFQANSEHQVWSGQVGYTDGVCFGMTNPGRAVPNASKYHVKRKNEFALLCIATCDQARRIMAYDISMTPTTHDSLAWANSSLGMAVNNGRLPKEFHLCGDFAFNQSESMMVPGGTENLDAYDFVQSSQRMPIECTFGMLVRRWGVVWRPISCRFDRRAPLVGTLMRLHNVCVEMKISDDFAQEQDGMALIQPGRWAKTPRFDRKGRPVDFLTVETDAEGRPPPQNPAANRNRKRDELVASIRRAGIQRPQLPRGVHKKKKRWPSR